MDDATALVRAKTALEELGSAAAHRIGEWRAERLVDDVSAGLVELARVNQAAIGELLAERDEAREEAAATRLGAERQAQRAAMAEAQLTKALERLDVYVSSADSLAAVMYERDEARAENERLREALNQHRPPSCPCRACEAVKLAAAQEPPAEGGDR